MDPSLVAFLVAFAASVLIAPLLASAARRLGIVDAPDSHRKTHSHRIPLVGGPTILISGGLAFGLAMAFFPGVLIPDPSDLRFIRALSCAGLVVVVLGLADDWVGLRGRQKLLGQLIAAVIMLTADVTITHVVFFGQEIQFGHFAPLITLAWILGGINALNLIDGVDGLASTTGIVLSLSFAAVAYVLGGRHDDMVLALILAGSLSGFLIHNFPPAKMFLGDSGSMLIGLVLGAVALKSSLKGIGAATLVMPTAIWAIPIFDVAMAVIRRTLTGRSIYATDRSHLHHCLERKGHRGSRLLLVVGSLCALTGLGAVFGSAMDNEWITLVAVGTALSLLVLTQSFGHTEMGLVRRRVMRLVGSMVSRTPSNPELLNDERVRLNGNHDWERLWVTLTEFADRFEMDRVELMVSLPVAGEEYHAVWRRDTSVEDHEAWKSEIPLIVAGMSVGHIRVAGAVGEGSICEWMSGLIGGLQGFEDQLVVLIQELEDRAVPPVAVEAAVPASTK